MNFPRNFLPLFRYNQLVHNKTKSGNKIHRESFPFAITGMNLTMLLFDIIGWGMKSSLQQESKAKFTLIKLLFESSDNQNSETIVVVSKTFNELYCLSFHLFDIEWKEQNASYFDFPKVLNSTKTKLENLLLNLKSVNQIVDYNNKIVKYHEHQE